VKKRRTTAAQSRRVRAVSGGSCGDGGREDCKIRRFRALPGMTAEIMPRMTAARMGMGMGAMRFGVF
jgi:hypothetical protein